MSIFGVSLFGSKHVLSEKRDHFECRIKTVVLLKRVSGWSVYATSGDEDDGYITPFRTANLPQGLVQYCARFIPSFAIIASPLWDLTKAHAKWKWGTSEEKAFQAVKRQLTQAPVMAFFKQGAETRITTDASPVGIGAVLEQKKEKMASTDLCTMWAVSWLLQKADILNLRRKPWRWSGAMKSSSCTSMETILRFELTISRWSLCLDHVQNHLQPELKDGCHTCNSLSIASDTSLAEKTLLMPWVDCQ